VECTAQKVGDTQRRRASLAQHEIENLQLDYNDSLVRLLLEGAFLYFDHTYEIVGINVVCLHTYSSTTGTELSVDASTPERPSASLDAATCAVYFGEASNMTPDSMESLEQRGRWWPVTTELSHSLEVCVLSSVLCPHPPCVFPLSVPFFLCLYLCLYLWWCLSAS
jgi:hypothetical protein